MSRLPFAKYDAEFRKDHPETIGETDQTFARSNYCEWLEKRVADRDALRAELDTVRGAIRADDERLYAAWVRIHGAPDDCANIGCDAPEWMADEVLRLRAELDRTKGEMAILREIADIARPRVRKLDTAALCDATRRLDALRAALERKADA